LLLQVSGPGGVQLVSAGAGTQAASWHALQGPHWLSSGAQTPSAQTPQPQHTPQGSPIFAQSGASVVLLRSAVVAVVVLLAPVLLVVGSMAPLLVMALPVLDALLLVTGSWVRPVSAAVVPGPASLAVAAPSLSSKAGLGLVQASTVAAASAAITVEGCMRVHEDRPGAAACPAEAAQPLRPR